jgi:hypothetical protein
MKTMTGLLFFVMDVSESSVSTVLPPACGRMKPLIALGRHLVHAVTDRKVDAALATVLLGSPSTVGGGVGVA